MNQIVQIKIYYEDRVHTMTLDKEGNIKKDEWLGI